MIISIKYYFPNRGIHPTRVFTVRSKNCHNNKITQLLSDELDVSQFSANAFSADSNANLVGGCRTAVGRWYESSVAEQMADKVGGTVKGSDVRVHYPGGVASDRQLVAPNKGHIVSIPGRNRREDLGVVIKAEAEDKSHTSQLTNIRKIKLDKKIFEVPSDYRPATTKELAEINRQFPAH